MPILQIRQAAVETLLAHLASAHAYSKKQIAEIGRSIRQFGFTVPTIVDENTSSWPDTTDGLRRSISGSSLWWP